MWKTWKLVLYNKHSDVRNLNNMPCLKPSELHHNPKLKTLSLFIITIHVVSNMSFFCRTQMKIFWMKVFVHTMKSLGPNLHWTPLTVIMLTCTNFHQSKWIKSDFRFWKLIIWNKKSTIWFTYFSYMCIACIVEKNGINYGINPVPNRLCCMKM